ncbi:hypothetical protein M5689_018938 [Euphorbia peplus]|nr:hypothetical protein M5689_018938 [Euphorbia peplus]
MSDHLRSQLARQYVPLDVIDWRKVSDKNNMWEFVKDKYIIPEEGKPWVMHTIREAWKAYKCRIKANHYTCYDNDDERLEHKPDDIPLEEFKTLLNYWADEKVQKVAEKNPESRKKMTDIHTAGPRSFAQIKRNLQLEKPNKEVLSRAEIFVATRKRTKGRDYKAPTEILNYRIVQIRSSGANEETVEQLISGDTQHGESWLVGRRAVPKKSKKKSKESTEKNSDSYVEELTAKIKKQLEEEMDEKMKKKMEEMAENMNKKLKEMAENMNQRMKENLRWMMRKLGVAKALVEVDLEEICGTSSENNNVVVSSKEDAPSDQEIEG